MLQGGEHLTLESLVMKVEGMDSFGRAAALWATDSGQHWLKDFFPQDEQCCEGSDAGSSDSITASLSDPLYQCLAAQLAQVIGGLAGIIFGHGTALSGSHASGQFFSGEAVRLRGQCDERFGYCT